MNSSITGPNRSQARNSYHREQVFLLVANESSKLLGRSRSEAQVFWDKQGRNQRVVFDKSLWFSARPTKLATIMCITDQAFSKFSGSAEVRRREAEKAWVWWAGFSAAFCSDASESGWSVGRVPMERWIGWDSLEGGRNYGDLESE
jgi:hypothetical protein